MGLAGRIGRMSMIILAVILLVGCFSFRGPNRGNNGNEPELKMFDKSFYVMDTVVLVQLYTQLDAKADSIFDDVQEEMTRLENILSAHLSNSDVAIIDEAAGIEPVQVNPETLAVISTALEYAELTNGAFDITLAPVLRLYNFRKGHEAMPSIYQLETNLPLVDWQKVVIDEDAGTVFLIEKDMKIDLGGIAKGFIIDRVYDILRNQGIDFGLINAGGDIRFMGPKTDGKPWRIGIKNPDMPDLKYYAIVEMARGSIVTSGDYERKFDSEGVRYHHIIDPETGLPANDVRSVTVVASSAELADLLSTAVFVLGRSAGMELIENLTNIEVIIWDSDDEVTWSSGLELVPDGAPSVDYFFRIS